MKSKSQKDLDRQLAVYDERIEDVKQRLIKALDCADAMMYVACNAATFEPVCVTENGTIITSVRANIKLHNSREDAARTAVRAHQGGRSSLFIVMHLSSALNYHIEWLKGRKDISIRLHAAMKSKERQAKARGIIKKETGKWWDKV